MTIFEKILNKQLEVPIVYEDEDVIAINDLHPQSAYHLLIIPKKNARSMNDLARWSNEACGLYFKAAVKVAHHLKLDDGYRIIINTGIKGGQTIDYLHLHLLSGELEESFYK